jgi:nucleotide-binding universal stress UspA family protein
MSSRPIVVGTDGSPTAKLAVDKAGEVARALGATAHVVCVPGALEAYEWPARISAQQIVAAAAERLQSRGINAETHLPKDQGDAGLALVAVAEQEQAQMIVVGNKGMTGIRRLLGSLPNTVSHQARCDVLIVPTQSDSLPEFAGRSVVVGADGPGATREAIRLAKALGGGLHVVSGSKPRDSQEPAPEAVTAEAAEQGVSVTTHARDGDLADGLLDVADKHDAAIVVVGGKGMRAGDRERFGNVSDKLSHKGTVSVLIAFSADETADPGDAVSGVTAED